jgi:hypothetical protein
MKLSVLDGFQVENQEYQVGLIFYYPTGKHQLRAQIWNLKTDDVLFETIISDWNKAVAMACTWQHITGEENVEGRMKKIISEMRGESKKSPNFV